MNETKINNLLHKINYHNKQQKTCESKLAKLICPLKIGQTIKNFISYPEKYSKYSIIIDDIKMYNCQELKWAACGHIVFKNKNRLNVFFNQRAYENPKFIMNRDAMYYY